MDRKQDQIASLRRDVSGLDTKVGRMHGKVSELWRIALWKKQIEPDPKTGLVTFLFTNLLLAVIAIGIIYKYVYGRSNSDISEYFSYALPAIGAIAVGLYLFFRNLISPDAQPRVA